MAQIRKNEGKNGITYTVRVRKNRKEATKTFTRKTDARTWEKKKETEFSEGIAPSKEARKNTVAALFEKYLKSILRESPNRYDYIKLHLDWWLVHFGTLKLFDVEAIHICTARETLLDETTHMGTLRSPATANRYMSSMRQAFEFGVTRLGWLQFNVAKQISQLTEADPPERFLDREDELPKLAEECGKSRNRRLLSLLMLALATGLRKASLVGLRENEVNIEKKIIRIPGSRMKKKNMITHSISDEVMPYLISLYENRNRTTGLLFPGKKNPSKPMNFEKAWKNALKRAKIDGYRFHTNRHTTGTYLTESGFTLAEVAAFLGQKTLVMALRYSHISDAHKAKIAPEMAKTYLADASKAALKHLKSTPTNE
jgi:integrase